MNLGIWNTKDKTRLKLVTCGNDVDVVVVDEKGDIVSGGNLLCFKEDGTIKRYVSVTPELGFLLDEDGKIEEDESNDE